MKNIKMLPLLTLAVSLLMIACPIMAKAQQQYTLSTLSTQNQLPSATLHSVFRDSEGFMWYCTPSSGICRDNGYQVDVFRPSDLTHRDASNQIFMLDETKDGRLLVATACGLFVMDKFNYQLAQTELDDDKINCLLVDRKGHIWVGLNDKVVEMDRSLHIINHYSSKWKGKVCMPSRFFEDSKGHLYVMQYDGGMLVKGKKDKQFSPVEWPLASWPSMMVEDRSNGCMWIGTWGEGIVRCVMEGTHCWVRKNDATLGQLEKQQVLYMLQDSRDGRLWVSTMDNLYAYDVVGTTLREFPTSTFLPPERKILDGMLETPNGSIYVCGFSPHTFLISPNEHAVSRTTVDAVQQITGYKLLADRTLHEGDYLWLWQGRMGLTLYNTKTLQLDLSNWWPERDIERNKSEKAGLWAVGDRTLYRVWQEEGRLCRNSVGVSPDGNKLITVRDDGSGHLFVLSKKSLFEWTIENHRWRKIAALTGSANTMAHSHDNHECYIIEDGHTLLIVSDKGKINKLSCDAILSDLSLATDGSVWLCSRDGKVYRYQSSEKALQHIDYPNDDSDIPLKDIVVDGLGHVWTASDQCVVEYNPENQAYREFRADDDNINVDYFYGIELEDPLHICLDGAGALCEVESSSSLNHREVGVSPLVSAYIVNGQKHLLCKGQDEVELHPGKTNLTLWLTTQCQDVAGDIAFAYILEGIDRNWIYNERGNNCVSLGNLPPGTYHLIVKATDRYGCWGSETEVLTIVSLAPWYRTWWAYLIYILLAIVLVYGIWRLERRIQLLHRLIRRRSEVRLNEIEMRREDITSTRIDDEFLQGAIQHVEKNLQNTNYNVEALANDMCMSRMNLYRRLQQQTGMTPTKFIRDIRLKKAAQIFVSSPEATIADVARRVGFQTPSYLTNCFKEKFGVMPKEYKKGDVK